MSKYTKKEIMFLSELKENIVRSHKKCDGLGWLKTSEACSCMKILKYISALTYSKLPSDYWTLSLDELEVETQNKKLVSDFIKNLDNAISRGLGIMFSSEQRGIGKTALICEIGKAALIKRYNVYYQIAQNIIDDKFTEEQNIIKRIKECDVLIIDELDKIAMKQESNIPKQLESLLREILPNHKTILIGTNYTENEVEEKFKIISLIKRYIEILPMQGKDYSEIKQKEWMLNLKKGKINYFHPNILTMAEKFYENQGVSDKKEYNDLF